MQEAKDAGVPFQHVTREFLIKAGLIPKAHVDRSKYLPHQGSRECARRLRQAVKV